MVDQKLSARETPTVHWMERRIHLVIWLVRELQYLVPMIVTVNSMVLGKNLDFDSVALILMVRTTPMETSMALPKRTVSMTKMVHYLDLMKRRALYSVPLIRMVPLSLSVHWMEPAMLMATQLVRNLSTACC